MYNLPILSQLIELLHWILVSIDTQLASWGLGPNWTWGLSIIGLTIIVRLVLFPLTWKQFSSAQRMQVIQPKLKELQKKYKGDRGKLQEETMKLYQEHRVNPFASCLPIILQLPVFIALYAAIKGLGPLDTTPPLPSVTALAHASFLWIPHLGLPDPYYILLIVYVVSQLISTELMLTPSTDKQQKYIMRAMPIIFVFMLYRFPAGLFVYWVTTNIWTIGQQLIIRRVMKPVSDAGQLKPAKRSRMMDVMAKAQEQRVQQRQDLLDKHGLPADGGQSGAKTSGAKTGGAKTGGAGRTGTAGKSGTARKGGARPSGKPRGGKSAPPPGKGKSKSGPGG